MKKVEGAWDERVAKERPAARSQPKFPWQVKPTTNATDQDRSDQLDQQTNPKKVPVTGAEKAPVTGTKKAPVEKSEIGVEKVTDTEKAPVATFRIPHQELDYLFRALDGGEFKLYLRLFRLSHGWGQETCKVGDNNLIEILNMSKNALRAAKRSLIDKKFIEIIQIVNLGPKGFTEYRILRTGEEQTANWYRKGTSSKKVTDTEKDPIKEDHDDDQLKKDHQRRAVARTASDDDYSIPDSHQIATQKIYQDLTGNKWKKSDQEAYKKIHDIPLATIEQAIQLAKQRATNRPNSFNYFVKEILNLADPSTQSRTQQKKALAKIVQQVKTVHTGAAHYGIADLAADVKDACVRQNILFNNDLFNEILGPS